MHENRETSGIPAARKCCRTAGEGHGRTARVYVTEESDSGILPMNHSNKNGKPLAESEEGRPLIMIWKQWKRGPARYAKLRQLGINKDLAAQTAGSPHGPWRLANSPALQCALPIAYFDALSLPRLFDGLA